MNKINTLLAVLLLLISCKEQNKKVTEEKTENLQQEYSLFGDVFELKNDINSYEMSEKYKNLGVLDTVKVKFTATVTDVCKAKGCWMKLSLNGKNEKDGTVMVRFKNYSFFVPKDIVGKQVVVKGEAFVEQMSIKDQKHYAIDAGEPEEVIAQIAKPKIVYGFNASGVLLKK